MTTTFRFLALIVLIAILYLTLGPVGVRELSPVPVPLDRALAFAVLAGFSVLAFPRHFVTVCIVVLVLVIGLEIAQELRPDRHARRLDAAIKVIGAVAGLTVGWVLRLTARRS